MSDSLVFLMGEFEADFPTNRIYAKNHMWAQAIGETQRFGFSAYAVRLLQDVYFLDWIIDPQTDILPQQEIGAIESSKAESELYAPVAGRLTRFNNQVVTDPALINVDKYDRGWLFEIDGQGDALMTPEQYIKHLEAVWEITQRTIKGQLH